jgi:hypothetical protein
MVNKFHSLNFLQKSEDALIPQPLLPRLGEGEPDFKVPLPSLGEGFGVRAGTFARGLLTRQKFRVVVGVREFDRASRPG